MLPKLKSFTVFYGVVPSFSFVLFNLGLVKVIVGKIFVVSFTCERDAMWYLERMKLKFSVDYEFSVCRKKRPYGGSLNTFCCYDAECIAMHWQ